MARSNHVYDPDDPQPPPSAARLWLFRLLALVLAPLLFLLLVEGALRAFDVGHPTRFWIPIEEREAVATNPAFGWRFFPPTLARRPIARDLAVPKPDGTYRIFVLGGSAAMGIPDPSYSFGRILEAMLQEAFPTTRFEVINAAMTAINSHVVLTIAGDSARHEPDLFAVYLGNNEVVGPWGAGSVLRTFSPNRPAIRAGIAVAGSRTGQFLGSLLGSLRRADDAPTGWQGMGLFVEHRLAADDPRLETVYAHYERNLEALARVARRAAVPLLLSTVPVNLRHSPPFASLSRPDLQPEDQQRFSDLFSEARDLALSARWSEAEAALEQAVAIDDRHAEARYLLGRARLEAGDPDGAGEHLRAARDLDALRFRADSRIQQIVRRVASKREGVVLVDAEERFAALSPAAAPGDELFWEHVHLSFSGNVELARLFFEHVVERLPEEVRGAAEVRPIDAHRVAERLALSAWDRLRQAEDIHRLMLGAPFDAQFGHQQRSAARRAALAELRAEVGPAALREAATLYQRALEERPDDLQLRADHAALLLRLGEPERAVEELRVALARVPESPGWLTDLGTALMEAGRFDDAVEAYAAAERIDPHAPDLPLDLGILELRRERFDAAIAHFRRALERDPGNGRARLNLAAALERLERHDEALREYREAVERAPERAEPRLRLGLALAARDDLEAAIAAYRSALELEPDRPLVHYNLGVAHERRGELAPALHHYSEALRLDPGNRQARDNAAALYGRRGAERARRGEIAEAIIDFERAVEIHPDHAPSRYNLAQALGLDGRIAEAVEQLRLTLELARRDGPPELAAEVAARLQALGERR